MGEYPDFRKPDRDQWDDFPDEAEADAPPSKQALQDIAHDRGRICKKRGCVVCAPLVERRREKKKERRAEAQARQHAKGEPCGRGSCALAVCVEARKAAAAAPPPVEPPTKSTRADRLAAEQQSEAQDDSELMLRRQADRHRAGLPCGSEDCPNKECIDGFANERTRRHRANRPCRAARCDNPICVAGRSKR